MPYSRNYNAILEKQWTVHFRTVKIHDYVSKLICTKKTFVAYNSQNILRLAKHNFFCRQSSIKSKTKARQHIANNNEEKKLKFT